MQALTRPYELWSILVSEALIRGLMDRRAALKSELDAVLVAPTADNRDLTVEEQTRFTETETEIRALDERITQLHEMIAADERSAQVAAQYQLNGPATGGARVQDASVYTRSSSINRGTSFFKDLNAARTGDVGAIERLTRNNREVADKKRDEQRAISTVNGAGGEFVPPLWMEDEFLKFLRAGRTFANGMTGRELPEGTDSINIPKITGGTAVASQATQNTVVQMTDITTGSVQSSVCTLAGGQVVSMQLVEQSPINFDEVVLSDLAADYAQKVGFQSLNGSGTGNQILGALTLPGTIAVAWTQANPALGGAGGLYGKFANAIQLIQTSRFRSPTAAYMHPRRWAWCLAASDASNRPLVVPNAGGPFNAAGISGEPTAEGFAGTMQGMPVFVDPNIPTTTGTGNNQDPIILALMSDLYLWEGTPRMEAFAQTYANQVSLFVRLYNYVSAQPGRYAQSIAVINGTGCVAPTF